MEKDQTQVFSFQRKRIRDGVKRDRQKRTRDQKLNRFAQENHSVEGEWSLARTSRNPDWDLHLFDLRSGFLPFPLSLSFRDRILWASSFRNFVGGLRRPTFLGVSADAFFPSHPYSFPLISYRFHTRRFFFELSSG